MADSVDTGQPQVLGIIGASSMVGQSLLNFVHSEQGRAWPIGQIIAFSRHPEQQKPVAGTSWRALGEAHTLTPMGVVSLWICLAPIWVLHQHFEFIQRSGAKRMVVLSSTSRFTKKVGSASDDPAENAVAQKLEFAEAAFTRWAESLDIQWVILRPTLIYDLGSDKNITEIARFIKRFGFFPLLGRANGLRQPVHAEDVATASVSALMKSGLTRKEYNISGGETLTYLEMVSRIFKAQGLQPRFIQVPWPLFKWGVALMRLSPRYKYWTPAMAQRMNRDLVFDHSEAKNDFSFSARKFLTD